MEYSNQKLPEGINSSTENPLKEMLKLMTVVALILVLLFWLLGLAANHLVSYVPFEFEKSFGKAMVPDNVITDGEIPGYLQSLTDRGSAQMSLPAGMTITAHYVDDPEVNAGATLGGELMINKGLLEKMPDENALAMVIGHEIGHVKLRHPLRSLGRVAVMTAATMMLTGSTTNGLGKFVINSASSLTGLSYTRDQEEAADTEGLNAMVALYGHAGGALELFDILLAEEKAHAGGMPRFNFLGNHPLSEKRHQAMLDLARENHWPTQGKIVSLPDSVAELGTDGS